MKKILLLGLNLMMCLCMVSCDDLIDNPPLDKIDNDAYWKRADDLDKYVLSFYTVFPTFKNSGVYASTFALDAVNGSDDEIRTNPNSVLNGTGAVVNSGGNWNWSSIRSILFFFDNYQKCQADFNAYKHFLGEAYFFKAYLYFDKVKAYGDVPWYTKTLEMDSPELYMPRTPRTEVVDSILYCLDKAIEYLSPLKTSSYGGSQRLSKEAALIFKSRVGLYEGSWQKYHMGTDFATQGADPAKYFRAAVEAAEELMIPGKYKVGIYNTGEPAMDYTNLFNKTDYFATDEVILWAGFSQDLNWTHSLLDNLTRGTNDIHITWELVSSYLSKNGSVYDYRKRAQILQGNDFLNDIADNCDARLKQTVWMPDDIMWDNNSYGKHLFDKPYLMKGGEFKNITGFQLRKGIDPYYPGLGNPQLPCEIGAIIFRYAEALLNYAEAKYELGESVDYERSINLLRARAGMPKFSIPQNLASSEKIDYGYSISDELYEIRRERRIELACENFRSDDYRRWRAHKIFQGKRMHGYPFKSSEWEGTVDIPVDADGFLDPHAVKCPNGYGFNEKRDYLQCIPTNEITLNPALEQNPGWSD